MYLLFTYFSNKKGLFSGYQIYVCMFYNKIYTQVLSHFQGNKYTQKEQHQFIQHTMHICRYFFAVRLVYISSGLYGLY